MVSTCCRYCFAEQSSLISVLEDYSFGHGKCACCGKEDVDLISPNSLISLFKPLLQLYTVNSKSNNNLIELLNKDWLIFQSSEICKLLMPSIISSSEYQSLINNNVSLNVGAEEEKEQWQSFCNEIKGRNRFFCVGSYNVKDVISKVLMRIQKKTIKAGSRLYRGRIAKGPITLQENELREPPSTMATSGRANPEGIAYLYLANNITTTLYESRAALKDYICIATFRAKRDMKIVSLSDIPRFDPFSDEYDARKLIKNKILLNEFAQALSKPIRTFDTKLEYVPTQYLCEYIKSNGADGVEYSSAMHEGGINYAIFDPQNFEFVCKEMHSIDEIIVKDSLLQL